METVETIVKHILPDKGGLKGKDIIDGGAKYSETVFYTEGIVQTILDKFMTIALAQLADLQEIYDLYERSQHKYPDSWWVKMLEPIFKRITMKDSYDLLSMHLRMKMIATVDKMEKDRTKMFARLNSPDLIFDELRMMIYNWRLE